MDCETCNALLADYKNAVSAFKNAVSGGAGATGADSHPAGKDAVRLAQAYRVDLFKSAVRNFAGAIGENSTRGAAEVERLRRECDDADERLMAHWHQEHPELAKSRNWE